MNANELKINDRVGFYRNHFDNFMEKGFGVVIKINGHGHIYVDPESNAEMKVFDKHGDERNHKYNGCTLCTAEWLEQKLATDKVNNAKQRAIRDLLDYLSGRRCGNGRYLIEAKHKEKIERLVEVL